MGRKAKEVKVIHRWKPEDDGEIPIEGDEMLGTAMNMANNMGQLQGIVEDSMPIIQPLTWFGFYGIGGAVAGNTAGHYLGSGVSEADVDAKRLAMRLGYLAVSGIASVATNGLPSGMAEVVRAGGVAGGSFLLAARKTVAENDSMRKYMLQGALAGYGASTVSYAITKFMNR
jgi:hypothetical protein